MRRPINMNDPTSFPEVQVEKAVHLRRKHGPAGGADPAEPVSPRLTDQAFGRARAEIAKAKAEGSGRLSLAGEEFRALDRIPEEIAACDALRVLDLDNSKVSDLTPLSGLTGLTDLGLDGTGVTDLTPLSGLTGLRRLGLGGTGVTDLTPLSGLTGLRRLGLGRTGVTDLTPLSGLTGLTALWLDGTGVTDLTLLSGLTGLTGLALNGTGVTDLTPLSGLTGLRRLWLDGTGVTDLTPLSGLTGLTGLWLDGTGVTDLTPLSGLTGLTELRLGRTGVTDLTPLSGLTGLTALWLNGTGVTDLTPLSGLTGLKRLDLDTGRVVDLRPIRGLRGLADDPETFGLTFKGCAACEADPEIARISEIKDDKERAAALFAYLENWQPPGEERNPSVSDVALDGPILSDALAEIEEQAEQFHAVSLTDGAAKPLDRRHADLVQALGFICTRMATAQVENRLGREVRQNFRDYGAFVAQEPINGRILHFLAQGIRGVLSDPYAAEAMDAFDETQLTGFLGEHDALVREYYPDALRGAQYETETPPDVLVREVPAKLEAARQVLSAPEAQAIFAPSVSDTLEMLYRREEGARRGYLTAASAEDREAAGKELQRVSVQITAYLGRIKGRLTQWQARTGQWTKAQVDYAREHPLTVAGGASSLGAGVLWVVGKLTPVFEGFWKLVGNLPLPF